MKRLLKLLGFTIYPLSEKEQLKIKKDITFRTYLYMNLNGVLPGDIIEHESSLTLVFTERHIDGANCYPKGFDPSMRHCDFGEIKHTDGIGNCRKIS